MGSQPGPVRAEQRPINHGARRSLRFLFVEDDADYQEVLRILVSRVSTAQPVESLFLSSVTDARRVVEATSVDAIVSDYDLPDGTGVELLDSARHSGAHRVILTGHPEIARTSEGFARSVHRVWDKSLAPKELQDRLERLVRDIGAAN